MNYLILETAFIGDAVLSMAIAAEIKRQEPESHVTYLVRKDLAPLIRYSPDIDFVIPFDKKGSQSGVKGLEEVAKAASERHYDFLLLLHSSERSKRLAARIKALEVVGFGETTKLVTKGVWEADFPRRTMRALHLLSAIFPEVIYETLPRLDTRSVALPIILPEKYVVIAPESVWKTKEWGSAKFEEIAWRLAHNDITVVFLGTKSSVVSTLQNAIDLRGKTNLVQAATVIARARLVVANDSASVHLATAQGVPTVTVFGPTVPEFGFIPPANLGTSVGIDLWCRPCTSHGSYDCPIHTHECMTNLSVDLIYQAAQEVLSGSK